jgi:SET domain-containing protein
MSLKKTLKVAKSKIHGKGLFATETIKKGTVIGYCKTRKTKKPGDHTLWLDAGPVDVTCRLKYINHNSKPNVAYYDDLSVVALKKIKPGDELTHHYGADWD